MSNDDDDVDNRVAEIAAMTPGPDLGAALAGVDIAGLSAHELVVVLRGWQRQQACADAQLVRVLAALVGCVEYQRCTCPTDADIAHTHRAVEPCGDEVSLALSWPPARAKNYVVTAVELTEELPDTLAALRSGRLDGEKARLIADRTRCLGSVELRRRVEARVLPAADTKTRTQLDYQLRRAVIAVDPAAAEQRRRDAVQGRRVSRPEPASTSATSAAATPPAPPRRAQALQAALVPARAPAIAQGWTSAAPVRMAALALTVGLSGWGGDAAKLPR